MAAASVPAERAEQKTAERAKKAPKPPGTPWWLWVAVAAIVLRPPRPLATSMTWTPLYEEPMVLVVPRRPPFKLPREPLAALAQAPFIRFDRDTWTGLLVRDVLADVPGAATVVDHEVARDPVQPGTCRVVVAGHDLGVPPRAHHRLLHHVLRELVVAREPHDVVVQRPRVRRVQGAQELVRVVVHARPTSRPVTHTTDRTGSGFR